MAVTARSASKEMMIFFIIFKMFSCLNIVCFVCFLILHYKKKAALTEVRNRQMKGGVVPPGIEPGTQGFSVLCSTN